MCWNRTIALVTACFALFLWTERATCAATSSTAEDEKTLEAAHVATDSAGLVDYFRKRTLRAEDEQQITVLIQRLGSFSYRTRRQATAALVARGSAAIPALNQALQNPDLEVARRAESALRLIKNQDGGPGVTAAAVRLIGVKKPAATVETLLAFLPFAENDVVAEEVQAVLVGLAVHQGKPNPTLVGALQDKHPVKRAAAGEALCQAGLVKQLPAIRKLLRDAEPVVRLRVALALAGARDKQAIPVVIDVLAKLPPEKAFLAQDFLYRLGEENSPSESLGRDEAGRIKCRDAWAAWWQKHGPTINLAKLSAKPRLLGYTLLLFLDDGKLVERDAAGKERWALDGLRFPLDVQVLPGKRLLITEHGAGRVAERNRKGEVLWEKKIAQPLMAQRLPNGNTFIGTRTELVEVNRAGKVVFTYNPPNGDLFMRGQKLPGGDIAFVSMDEQMGSCKFVRLTPAGKQILNFPVNVSTYGGRIEVLPKGRVLVPEMAFNRVVEYDNAGKMVWQATVRGPVAAVRLANGNTLVTTFNQNRAIELDAKGEEVAEFKGETRLNRAWRR